MAFARRVACIGLAALALAAPRARADDASEEKLRETLKSTTMQLRDAQNQVATLQAAQADNDQKVKDMAGQLALLKKHAADDKAASDGSVATLTAKASDQAAEIAKLREALDKWQAAYRQVKDDAAVAGEERAKLAEEKIVLQRKVEYLQSKNVELFKLGNEILDRYQNFSLGNALAAKEPFIGVTRTKLETAIQDYQDKIADARAQ